MDGYYPLENSSETEETETNDELTWINLGSVVIDQTDPTTFSLEDIPSETYTDDRVGFQYFKFDAALSESSVQSSVTGLIFPEIKLIGKQYKNTTWTPDILTMTVTTTIPLDGKSTMFGLRDLSTKKTSENINWLLATADEFNPIMSDENGTSGYLINRTALISDLLSQTDGEINNSLIIGSQSISELYASLSGNPDTTTTYLDMRVDVGSIFTEYPIISTVDNITLPTETEKEISFQTTYSFKNWADFVLFYYYYKHTINHYLCKLSLLFKSFNFYANQLNNNGTLSRYII